MSALFGACSIDAAVRAAGSAGEDEFISVAVEYVIDGDSLMTRFEDRRLEVRLWGIDAPEFDQPGSRRATEKLKQLVLGRQLELNIKDRDKYGRTVALAKHGRKIINEQMVSSGNAWVYRHYCRETLCETWIEFERKARDQRLGLWNDDEVIAPWLWKTNR